MSLGLSLTLYAVLALRLGLLVYGGIQLRYIGQAKSYHPYDVAVFRYLLAFVVGILAANFITTDVMPEIIVIDAAVFVFFLAVPIRFIYQAIPSLALTLGEFLVIFITLAVWNSSEIYTAFFSLIFVNIIAFLASLQLHSYRWRIFQNFLERKETERLVAIGQTAGMIGHDIRNPLQAIVSELYLAKQAVSVSPHIADKASALESISLIEEQTDYISKIVSDLQDFARPLKPEYSDVNLPQLVTSVFQTIKVPDNIMLKINVEGLPKIETDPTLIKRILTNLINNAIQAMPKGGNLELMACIKEGKAVITVGDTGQGIPEEIKPKLFTPLVTSKAKGQGLGLAVVKRIVEALNGSITFESEEDKGTKFIIKLPIESP
jgi:signal transduction histidine kinase